MKECKEGGRKKGRKGVRKEEREGGRRKGREGRRKEGWLWLFWGFFCDLM